MGFELEFASEQVRQHFESLPPNEQERIRAVYEARYLKRQAANQRKIDTFWDKLDKSSECWVWTGPRNLAGYGIHSIGTLNAAHRIAYALSHDGSVPKGLCVCHHCDNPPCCRPDHLFLGTVADNTRDMIAKGRQRHAKPIPVSDPLFVGTANACRILECSVYELNNNVNWGLITRYVVPGVAAHYLRSELVELAEASHGGDFTSIEELEAWREAWRQRKTVIRA